MKKAFVKLHRKLLLGVHSVAMEGLLHRLLSLMSFIFKVGCKHCKAIAANAKGMIFKHIECAKKTAMQEQ